MVHSGLTKCFIKSFIVCMTHLALFMADSLRLQLPSYGLLSTAARLCFLRLNHVSVLLCVCVCVPAEGVKAEAAYAKDGTLPDPTSTTNPEFQIVLALIKDGLARDPTKYTRMAKRCKYVSSPTFLAPNVALLLLCASDCVADRSLPGCCVWGLQSHCQAVGSLGCKFQ
jgi:hypothetical protein